MLGRRVVIPYHCMHALLGGGHNIQSTVHIPKALPCVTEHSDAYLCVHRHLLEADNLTTLHRRQLVGSIPRSPFPTSHQTLNTIYWGLGSSTNATSARGSRTSSEGHLVPRHSRELFRLEGVTMLRDPHPSVWVTDGSHTSILLRRRLWYL